MTCSSLHSTCAARLAAAFLIALPGLGCGVAATSTLPPGAGVELNLFVGDDFQPFGLPTGSEVRWLDLEFGESGFATVGSAEGARVPISAALAVAIEQAESVHDGWLIATLDTREMVVDASGWSQFTRLDRTVELTVAMGEGPPECLVVIEPVHGHTGLPPISDEWFDALYAVLVTDWSGATGAVGLDSQIASGLAREPRRQLLPRRNRSAAFESHSSVQFVAYEGEDSIVRLSAPQDGAWAPHSTDGPVLEWLQFNTLLEQRRLSDSVPVRPTRDNLAPVGPVSAIEVPASGHVVTVAVPEALVEFAADMEVRSYSIEKDSKRYSALRDRRGTSQFNSATGCFEVDSEGSGPGLLSFQWRDASGERVHLVPFEQERAGSDVAWGDAAGVQLAIVVDSACFDDLRPEFGPVPEVLAKLTVQPDPEHRLFWGLEFALDRPGPCRVSGLPDGALVDWLDGVVRLLPDVESTLPRLVISPELTSQTRVEGAELVLSPHPFDLAEHPRETIQFVVPAGVIVGRSQSPMLQIGHRRGASRGIDENDVQVGFNGVFQVERAAGDWVQMRLELVSSDGTNFVGAVLADEVTDGEARVTLELAARVTGRTDWVDEAGAHARYLSCTGSWTAERLMRVDPQVDAPGELPLSEHSCDLDVDGGFSVDFLRPGGTYTLTFPRLGSTTARTHTFTVPLGSGGMTVDLGLIR